MPADRNLTVTAAFAPVGAHQPTSYDPATETDPLLRDRITRDPVTAEAVFRAIDYPVWAVVLNLQGATDNGADVLRLFPGLTPDDLRAARLFHQRHPEEVEDHLK